MSFSINEQLLRIKVVYFLTFAGLCPLTCFGPTLAKQLGFSASALGFMYSVSIVSSIFARLILGYVADKFQKHKTLLISSVFVCACSILLLSLFPQKKLLRVSLLFDQNSTSFAICLPLNTDSGASGLEFVEKTSSDDGRLCEMYCAEKSYLLSFEKNNTRHNEISPAYTVNIDDRFLKLDSVCFNGHRLIDNIDVFEEQKNQNFPIICSVASNNEPKSILTEFSEPMFWVFFCVYAVYFVSNFVICVFTDTVCFQILDNVGGKFGNQRMFASMGWGTAALLSGLLTDYFSRGEYSKNYLPACVLAFAFLTATGVLLIFFKMPYVETATKIGSKTLRTVLWNTKSSNFACWCFFIGIYSAVVWQYSFWIIEETSNVEELTWDKSLQGILVVVNTILGDVPTYYFFDYTISRLGYVHCMTLTLFLNGVRLFAYSILSRPIWAIPISVLDGFTFGISYATIASYANFISTPDSKTTVQAIFNSIFDGIGTSFGGLCFGFVYYWCGGAFSFRLCSFIAFFTTFSHLFLHWCLKTNTR